jgi:hypothetical protein
MRIDVEKTIYSKYHIGLQSVKRKNIIYVTPVIVVYSIISLKKGD